MTELPDLSSGVGIWSVPTWRTGPRAPRVAPEERRRVANRLLVLRAAGDLSHAHVEQAAAGVGVTARTIYR
jgi:hypothetical protein